MRTDSFLEQLDELPPGLTELGARELHTRLSGPTLIHLPGRREPALFVSVLLHGNEDTGWEALRRLLARYQSQGLPRSLSLLIGNVEAARFGKRRLDHQPDYNRLWNGTGDGPEQRMAQEVLATMRQRGVFASVDVHNNTGRNPHYGCINRIDYRFMHLAALFARTCVYFINPDSVQSIAFAELCPAVTIECGQAGQARGIEHAMEFLDACLHLTELPTHPVAPGDLDVFHTVGIVKIPDSCLFDVGTGEHDLCLYEGLEELNFRELPVGTALGRVRNGTRLPLQVFDERGIDVAERFFVLEGGELCTRMPVVPSMITVDPQAIRQDCLCYVMERYPLPSPR